MSTGLVVWVLDIYVPAAERLALEPWPVVQHLFYGRDLAQALGRYHEHLGFDPVARAAVLEGRLGDRPCHASTTSRPDVVLTDAPRPIRPAAIGIGLSVDSYPELGEVPTMSHVFYGPEGGAVEAWEAYTKHEDGLGLSAARRVRWYEDGRWTEGDAC